MKPQMLAVYVEGLGYSGQAISSHIVCAQISRAGIDVKRAIFPPLPRGKGIREYLRLAPRWISAWVTVLHGFRERRFVYANIGQSWASVLREGLAIWFLGRAGRKVIISLHGAIFHRWSGREFICRAWLCVLRSGVEVTVLGPQQKEILEHLLGASGPNVSILPNTAWLSPLTTEELEAKLGQPACRHRIGYLGNLIDTKGYPEFLEAMVLLAKQGHLKGCGVDLMGPWTPNPHNRRFSSKSEAAAFIEECEHVLSSCDVDFQWHEYVDEKQKSVVLRDTTIFVFPSTYAVEAQPRVVIEAMAAGCAVVASRVGELEFMGENGAIVLLKKTSPQTIAEEVGALINSRDGWCAAVRNANARYFRLFSFDAHFENWANAWARCGIVIPEAGPAHSLAAHK